MGVSRGRPGPTLPPAQVGRSGWKVRDDLDAGRPFEFGEAFLAAFRQVIAQRGVRDVHRYDERDGHLAENGVRPAHDRGVAHPWVGEQDRLDLARIHLLTTTVDHVVGAAGQEEIAVRVEKTDVAGVEPTVVGESVAAGRTRIGANHPWPADLHRADHVGRAYRAVVIDDADLAVDRHAHRTRLAGPMRRIGRDQASGLGHAICFQYGNTGCGLECP